MRELLTRHDDKFGRSAWQAIADELNATLGPSCDGLDELRNLASDVNEAEIRSHLGAVVLGDDMQDWLDAWHAEFERILQAMEL